MVCMDFQPAVRVKGGGKGSVLSRVMGLYSVWSKSPTVAAQDSQQTQRVLYLWDNPNKNWIPI